MRRSGTGAFGRIPQWEGRILRESVHPYRAAARDELADAARAANWPQVLSVVSRAAREPCSENRGWINAVRLDGHRGYAPLHQAARHGAPVDAVKALLGCGAWRTLRNSDGKRPLDIPQERGHHLTRILQPEIKHQVPDAVLAGLQRNLHTLITRYDSDAPSYLRLPEVEVLTELDPPAYRIRICGGIFIIELRGFELNAQAVGKMDYSTPPPYRITVGRIHKPE
ncbi:ankyrin repeat domain-containing protein [Streptomyces sp. NPDC047000]|uniref:ankyrin repeat domain-containing protein n=1 Tax=Streptomyces sp. NPDC047000 TaxID=3155474 RepID=UPI0033DDC13C